MAAARDGVVSRIGTLLVLIAAVTACASSRGPADAAEGLAAEDTTNKTQQEVQSALMAFADRYFAATLETAKTLERALDTPESRYTAAAARLVALMVTTDIAASPNPGAALLDMAVFVTLRRMVWEDYWMPEVYGEAGTPVLEALVELEDDIWEIAAGVFTAQQLGELRGLIDDWRARRSSAGSPSRSCVTERANERRFVRSLRTSKHQRS